MLKSFGFLVLSCALLMGGPLGAQDSPFVDEDADGLDDRSVRRAPKKEGVDASRAKGAGSKKIKAKQRGPGAEDKAVTRDARGLRAGSKKGARAKLRAAVAQGKLSAGEAGLAIKPVVALLRTLQRRSGLKPASARAAMPIPENAAVDELF